MSFKNEKLQSYKIIDHNNYDQTVEGVYAITEEGSFTYFTSWDSVILAVQTVRIAQIERID